MAAARHLLSRARLLITRHRRAPTLPPALTRFLFGGAERTQQPEDKARAAAAAAVALEASAKRAKKEGSDDDDEDAAGLPWRAWRPDVAWLSRALEPALQLYNYKHYNWKPFASGDNIPASTRSFSEILSDLQRSKVSIKDWSLSDLTIGLYLIYLSQASAKDAQAFKGVQISSNKKDYKLRLVGHSLGGASAALLAIMLRKKSKEELGFSPNIISAVGFGVPPCVSREIAESCSSFVSTVVLQDDIVPRLSAASLARLRNEIIETDWAKVLEKEDWKHIVDIVTNAMLVVTSIQDVANKLADYAKVVTTSASSDVTKEPPPRLQSSTKVSPRESEEDVYVPEDLFLPGTLYYLKRDVEVVNGVEDESYTLWRGDAGENFQRILLSGNLMSDHKCESIQYALRDVLKTLPLPQPLQQEE